jgi:hypothetical protein
LIDDRSATVRLAATLPVHAVSAAAVFRTGISAQTMFSFREAALTWLRFMAGIKQSVSLRKKAAPPILLLSYFFSFSKESNKIVRCSRLFSFLKATF